jgi:hypothetical protein
MSWGSILLMVLVSVGIFYILMSITTHPNPNYGFYFLNIRNLMYISALLLVILGLIIYLYSYNLCFNGDHRQSCKLAAFFYILTFIGVILISWLSFNYHIDGRGLIGLVLIIIGLIIFAFS